jgi:hypothetical protein
MCARADSYGHQHTSGFADTPPNEMESRPVAELLTRATPSAIVPLTVRGNRRPFVGAVPLVGGSPGALTRGRMRRWLIIWMLRV